MAAMTICFAERTPIIIQLLIMIFISAAAAQQDPPDCQRWCGDVEIPHPFGTTESCALDAKFLINCSNGEPILGENLEVTNISIENHEVSIMSYIAKLCHKNAEEQNRPSLEVPRFTISSSKNKFTVVGCDSYGYLYGNYKTQNNYSTATGCFTRCVNLDRVSANDSCSGIGCCHMDIPPGLKNIYVKPFSFYNYTKVIMDLNPCTYAFVVEQGKFNFSQGYLLNGFTPEKLPLVLEWSIDNDTCAAARHQATPAFCPCEGNSTTHYLNDSSGSYYCNCIRGFNENPYTPLGCQGVNMKETEYLLAETSNGNDATAAYDSISNHVALDFSGR
ncbi:hypothetical protein FEM48_Zijuj01G0334600 [Ziziphus jujuba var. spinosa]|uniref:Wall-associated receptor kinase galacturonan-binding domain-containing protein n=1 Tax=Ziziphus jujuba var. spinosa TaxID=714518 RepID=A0A978W6T4_ZIZJJ|nr:hypothetical protein FEM48_Zijuj01G0334600 [Ziziphus jujuba var. spinosa]